MEQKNHRRLFIIEYIIIVVAVGILGLGYEIWFDESFSILITRNSISDIISFTASDVHPPLYYLFLKLFISIFGNYMPIYHLVSIIPFLLMILIVGIFSYKEISYKAGLLSMVVLCAAPHMLTYAIEIRMYSLCQLLVVCSVILAYKIGKSTDKEKWTLWIGFSIINVMAAYTHYFAGAAVAIVSVCLFVCILISKIEKKRKIIRWVIANVITVILYIPWLVVFYKQFESVKSDYWITSFTARDIGKIAEFLFGKFDETSTIFVGAAVCIAIVLFVIRWKKNSKLSIILLCLTVFLGFIALGVLLSIIITPVFVQRYIAIVLPCFWMAITYIFVGEKNQKLYYIMCVLSLLLLVKTYCSEYQWRVYDNKTTLFDTIKKEAQEEDVIYNDNPFSMAILSCYLPNQKVLVSQEGLSTEKFTRWDEMSQNITISDEINPLEQGDVWVCLYYEDDSALKALAAKGYDIEYVGEKELPGDKVVKKYKVYKCSLKK